LKGFSLGHPVYIPRNFATLNSEIDVQLYTINCNRQKQCCTVGLSTKGNIIHSQPDTAASLSIVMTLQKVAKSCIANPKEIFTTPNES